MTEHTLETLARQRMALKAQAEDIAARIAQIDALIVDAVEVGGRIDIDGQPAFRVQQRAPFDVDRACQVLPAEVVAACTETVTEQRVDRRRLEALAEGLGLRGQCVKPGRPFVAEVTR